MKTWTLKESSIVYWHTTDTIFQIYKFEVNGETLFYYNEGKSHNLFPWEDDLPRFFFYNTRNFDGKEYRKLVKAKNLLGAQAELIEKTIANRCKLEHYCNGEFPIKLMRELGKENLPLLLNFFTAPEAIKAFEEVLKNG
jgi:hypothetical protein